MSANTRAINASALNVFAPSHTEVIITHSFAAWVGFYYSVRLIFPLIAVHVLRLDPQDGIMASLALNFLFLVLAAFYSFGRAQRTLLSVLHLPCLRWVIAFFCFSGASLIWSVTASRSAAVAFWLAMAADTAIVLLLLRHAAPESVAASLMQGYVWGSCLIAFVAWLLPSQSDLRLGDEELLGPNQIGWACGFAFFFAQYLIRKRGLAWMMPAAALLLTLLRSLSKTTIIAFAVGEAYILLRDRVLKRGTKLLLIGVAALIVIAASSLLADYYTIYINAGNQSETLTGRFGIWLYILTEAIEKPWIGHGFHSVWKVIPPFGEFEARHAHNELLQQFYAYGVVGVFLLFAIYSSVWRQIRFLDTSRRVFFTGMLLLVLVRGLADTEVFDLSLPLWFIVIIGALVEQARIQRGVAA